MTPALPLAFASLRHSIRRNRTHAIVTAVLAGASAYATSWFFRWAVVDAVWTLPPGADSSACRAVAGRGACWAVVSERSRFILFGGYPYHQHWRPAVACLMFVALYAASTVRAWWNLPLAALWIAVPLAAIVLLLGGFLGLTYVQTDVWGGLPLTLVLSTVGFEAAIPLAVALALGRRSAMPAIGVLSVAYIELIRGVPVITFLFMASLMFPLFVPDGLTVDKLLRIWQKWFVVGCRLFRRVSTRLPRAWA